MKNGLRQETSARTPLMLRKITPPNSMDIPCMAIIFSCFPLEKAAISATLAFMIAAVAAPRRKAVDENGKSGGHKAPPTPKRP